MDISIERATQKDIHEILLLLKELYTELGEEKESVIYLNEEFLKNILNSEQTEIFLAKTPDHQVAGILTLTESQSIYAGGTYALLDEMFIVPQYRNSGIGTSFIKKMKEMGKQRSWKRIDVTAPTEERLNKAVNFYEKCGFVFTGPKLKLSIQ
ncbi:MAG: GCN5-related N-acetyltransferase [Bacteroidota bacterium]|jgi:GNAT superfamily N-acetyltransferase|nr:GCN5-related N-acetyltransferase [Bacteroidota bacterium]